MTPLTIPTHSAKPRLKDAQGRIALGSPVKFSAPAQCDAATDDIRKVVAKANV